MTFDRERISGVSVVDGRPAPLHSYTLSRQSIHHSNLIDSSRQTYFLASLFRDGNPAPGAASFNCLDIAQGALRCFDTT